MFVLFVFTFCLTFNHSTLAMFFQILLFIFFNQLFTNIRAQEFCRQIEQEAELLFRDALMIDKPVKIPETLGEIKEYCR